MVLVQLDPCPFNGAEESGMRDRRKIGFLEWDADLVAFLVRKECYANEEVREELEGYAELVLAKQRNGPTGWIPLTF
jgi:replicative DNA helicase